MDLCNMFMSKYVHTLLKEIISLMCFTGLHSKHGVHVTGFTSGLGSADGESWSKKIV